MAKLKKNKLKQAVEIEDAVKEVDTAVEETKEGAYLNSDEQKALSEQHEKDVESEGNVSTEKMQKTVSLVQNRFNLSEDHFALTGFADKGSKCVVSLSNDDFDISVVVKDTEKFFLG